jgi:hypothetical protein
MWRSSVSMQDAIVKYDLWMAEPADGHSLIRDDNIRAQEFALAQGMSVVWSTHAKGFNQASQLLYDYLGCGTYNAHLDEDGNPLPELEDDNFEKPW